MFHEDSLEEVLIEEFLNKIQEKIKIQLLDKYKIKIQLLDKYKIKASSDYLTGDEIEDEIFIVSIEKYVRFKVLEKTNTYLIFSIDK